MHHSDARLFGSLLVGMTALLLGACGAGADPNAAAQATSEPPSPVSSAPADPTPSQPEASSSSPAPAETAEAWAAPAPPTQGQVIGDDVDDQGEYEVNQMPVPTAGVAFADVLWVQVLGGDIVTGTLQWAAPLPADHEVQMSFSFGDAHGVDTRVSNGVHEDENVLLITHRGTGGFVECPDATWSSDAASARLEFTVPRECIELSKPWPVYWRLQVDAPDGTMWLDDVGNTWDDEFVIHWDGTSG